jgi:glycosyltransferase involved in cell wall biosynthesis
MKISLYIPCYNVEGHIERCIKGVLKQTLQPEKILVIDDGSTDRTAEIASNYPVKVIKHGSNRGLAAARN